MDPYYARLAPLVGHIVIEFGNLEGDAGRMLARLNEKWDDVSAAQHAAKDNFFEKIAKARKLVDQKIQDATLKAKFYHVLDEMERLNKLRNRYIHSEYLPELDNHDKIIGAYYRQIKQMGDVLDVNDPNSKIAVHKVDEREIRQLISDMSLLGLQIRATSEEYFDTLP